MEKQTVRTARIARDGAINLRQRRAWFDETPAEPTDTQPVENEDKGKATFTQADLNRVAGQRAKEAKQAAINDLLKELGFEKPDDLKTLVAAAKAREKADADKAEAEKTELQKLQDQMAVLESEKKAAEAKAAQIESARLVDRRNGAVRDALKEATKPEAVLVLLENSAKTELEAVMAEDGALDKTKIEALVTHAKKEWPEMFDRRQGAGSPSVSGGKTVGIDDKAARDANFARYRRGI